MKSLYAIMLLMGTIIGAGIIGLPYAFQKSGFLFGLMNLIVLGTIITVMTVYVGELSIYWKGKHQLTGYVGKFVGKDWKWVALLFETFGIYTALIAYYIGIGASISNFTGADPRIISTIFFLVASPFVYFGTKSVSKSEFFLMSIKIALVLFLFFALIPSIKIENLLIVHPEYMLFPFGITLFSLLGYTVMPEVSQIIKKNQIKKIVIISMVSSIAIYLVFTIGFVGAFSNVSQIPSQNLSGNLALVGDILIFLILSTPYLALSLALRDVYYLDLNMRKSFSWLLACLIPFFLYLYLNIGFINLLSISGTYAGGGLGILTMVSVLKAREKRKIRKATWPIYTSIIIFLIGIAYETVYLVGALS